MTRGDLAVIFVMESDGLSLDFVRDDGILVSTDFKPLSI